MNRGLIHIYCGDGKGKTTAAFGLALRSAGRGRRVAILQFLKGEPTGEVLAAEKIPEITILPGNASGKFTFQMNEAEKAEAKKRHDANLERVWSLASEGDYKLLILDEVMAAWTTGLLDGERLIALIEKKPPDLELVMTGRNPPEVLLALADYVTEMKKIKHPFDRGIPSREGIEM